MYAGIDYPQGATLSSPELGIPLLDVDLHNGVSKGETHPEFFHSQADAMWTAPTGGANYEVHLHPPKSPGEMAGGGLIMSVPGVGALTVDHPSAVNAYWKEESVLDRTSIEQEGKTHVGRGAYTSYHNLTLAATDFIPAGMEILMNLDEQVEYSAELLKPIDYKDADESMDKILDFFKTHTLDEDGTLMTDDRIKDIAAFLVEVVRLSGTQGLNNDDTREEKDELRDVISKLIPEWPADMQRVKDAGGTFLHAFPDLKKTPEWLEENGQCMDKLRPGMSTIPNAGLGAFAAKAIAEGGLVAPAPLMIIPQKEWLDMYSISFKTAEEPFLYTVRNDDLTSAIGVRKKQLLLNYCFGHPKSSLLLHPQGAAVNLINHKSTSDGANAKLVWTQASYHQDQLLKLALDEWGKVEPIHSLGMDIVATRDIALDEEIFIDYGEEWAQAWEDHLQNWQLAKVWPTRAIDMNANMNEGDHYYTTTEQETDRTKAYSSDIMTGCYLITDEDVMEAIDGKEVLRFNSKADPKDVRSGHNLYLCEIMERSPIEGDSAKFEYTVLLPKKNEIVKYLPQENIQFFDKPYTSDLHFDGAFRHNIGIPDDIFPQSWRDLED